MAVLNTAPRRALPPVPPGIAIVVAICVLAEIVLSIADAGMVGTPWWRLYAVALAGFDDVVFDHHAAEVWPGQWWAMLLTHAFLHGGFLHLAMNMVALLGLGKLASAVVGPVRATLIFPVTAVGGGIAFGLIAATNVPMVGASGAVFGYLALWQAVELRMRLARGLPLGPVGMAFLGIVAGNALIWVGFGGNLAWEAHLGGYIAGWVLAIPWLGYLSAGGAGRP